MLLMNSACCALIGLAGFSTCQTKVKNFEPGPADFCFAISNSYMGNEVFSSSSKRRPNSPLKMLSEHDANSRLLATLFLIHHPKMGNRC